MRPFFIFCAVFFSTDCIAQKTYLHCGRLIDAISNTVQTNKTIVIEKNKIVDLLDGFAAPGVNDKLVDLKNKTVMPGLMDMHVHMESQTKRNAMAERLLPNSPGRSV